MQNLLLGSVLVCSYDEATKSWNFPCSSERITSLPQSKYFRNYYRLKIKSGRISKLNKNFSIVLQKGGIERNQSSTSSNIQYIVRNLLNKFNTSGTTEHSSENENEKQSTKYFWRYGTKES